MYQAVLKGLTLEDIAQPKIYICVCVEYENFAPSNITIKKNTVKFKTRSTEPRIH